jgi:hypothetical protein
MHAGLSLPCILPGCVAGCVLLAFGQTDATTSATAPAQDPTFRHPPFYPPTADADPAVRHEVVVPMPTRLSIERTSDRISVGFELASPRNVRINVGKKMTIGVKYEMRVYATNDARPVNAGGVGYASINEPVSASVRGLLNGRQFLNTGQGGVPAPGTRYNIEGDVSIFETDVPAQHMWMPESKRYRVLWETALKTVT